MSDLSEALRAELQEFSDSLEADHLPAFRQAVNDVSAFTTLMLADPTEANVAAQQQNIRHVMNTLANHAALAQYQAANKVRLAGITVIQRMTTAVLTALA